MTARESRFNAAKQPRFPLKAGRCRWCGKPTGDRTSWHEACALDYLRDKGAIRPFALDRNRREHGGTLTCEGYGRAPHVPSAEGKVEVDHKVPLFAGGTNDADNLQVLCVPCHRKKTRRDLRRDRFGHAIGLEEWLG